MGGGSYSGVDRMRQRKTLKAVVLIALNGKKSNYVAVYIPSSEYYTLINN